jgi:hypothetical protein
MTPGKALPIQQLPRHREFMFATGIENSYPTIQ